MKAFVTGASGFVGSHLVDHLIKTGFEVRCLVRKKSDMSYLTGKPVELVQGDLRDKESLRHAVDGVNYVFHLAAALHVQKPSADFHNTNELGTKNLLDECKENSNRLARFIHISSISSAGPRKTVEAVNEDSPCHPMDHYGKSKLKAEQQVLACRAQLPVTIIRPPLVYGPRDGNRLTVLPRMKMVNRGVYFTKGSPKSQFSCIHAGDLARGLVLAAEQPISAGSLYFLCNPSPTTYDEICSLTASALWKRAIKIVVPSPLLAMRRAACVLIPTNEKITIKAFSKAIRQPTLHWVCKGTKAEKELNFHPLISLGDGIAETAKWYLQRGWI